MISKTWLRPTRYAIGPVAIAAMALAGIGVAVAAAANDTGAANPTDAPAKHSGNPVSYSSAIKPATTSLSPVDAASRVVEGLGTTTAVQKVTAEEGPNGASITATLAHNNDDIPDL
ncbi:MAG: hypothetical protein JWP74_2556 [Marmoricola sp.]|nr:hypothetical protein [Marmoricola sp.]